MCSTNNGILKFLDMSLDDKIDYMVRKMVNKGFEKELKERSAKVDWVIEVHNSDIPNKIRNMDISLDIQKDFSDKRECLVHSKYEDFIKWYYDNVIKNVYSSSSIEDEKQKLINFIEKMAVWYELKYPNNDISKSYNKKYSNNSKTKGLNCDYNSFLNALSYEEDFYLQDAYIREIYFLKDVVNGSLRITPDGIVRAKKIRVYNSFSSLYIEEDFDGLNLLQVRKLFEACHLEEDVLGIDKIIDDYQLDVETRERVLDAVMYRILDRDNSMEGVIRGFIFAKEFHRNKDIPMMYVNNNLVDSFSTLIDEYIQLGGTKELIGTVGTKSISGNQKRKKLL